MMNMMPHSCVGNSDQEDHYGEYFKTLPKALRTQALTALTSNFGLVGLVCRLGLICLVWYVWFSMFVLVGLVW